MSDLIEREETINRIDKWYGGEHYTPAIISVIEDMPSAERPQGEWECDEYAIYHCSNCGCEATWDYNFCPNCGAKMKGAGDETD